jgi:8-oxo-dGTP diphosphatase
VAQNLSGPAPAPRVRVAALVVSGDSILLVLHRKEGREYYLLPGGGVEPGETEEEALKRELLEETGLAVTPLKLLFQTQSIRRDYLRCVIQKVYLCNAAGALAFSQDPRVIKVEYMKREEFKRAEFYPDIRAQILEAWETGFKGPSLSLTVPWKD